MKCFFKFLTITILFLPNIALAEDAVTLNKGEKAPYAGTLLSPSAVAKILAADQISKEQCDLKLNKTLDLEKARYDLNIAIEKNKTESCEEIAKRTSSINEEYIKDLEKISSKAKLRSDISFAGGVLTGIGITVVSAWALSKVAD